MTWSMIFATTLSETFSQETWCTLPRVYLLWSHEIYMWLGKINQSVLWPKESCFTDLWILQSLIFVRRWLSKKLPLECQKIAKNLTFFSKNCQKFSFFYRKKWMFLAIVWKKEVFCNFFYILMAIFRRGGSEVNPTRACLSTVWYSCVCYHSHQAKYVSVVVAYFDFAMSFTAKQNDTF